MDKLIFRWLMLTYWKNKINKCIIKMTRKITRICLLLKLMVVRLDINRT